MEDQLKEMEGFIRRRELAYQPPSIESSNTNTQQLFPLPRNSSAVSGSKFRSFINRYIGQYYKSEYERLLNLTVNDNNSSSRIRDETERLREKHELELQYIQKAHEQVKQHLTETLQQKELQQGELKEQVETLEQEAERLVTQRTDCSVLL